MSDQTAEIAALLNEHWLESPKRVTRPGGGIEIYATCSCGEWVPMPLDVDEGDPVMAFSEHLAARLVDAGLALAPQPDPASRDQAAAYGAVGDGIADDTAAIQAALNALPTKGGGGDHWTKDHNPSPHGPGCGHDLPTG